MNIKEILNIVWDTLVIIFITVVLTGFGLIGMAWLVAILFGDTGYQPH